MVYYKITVFSYILHFVHYRYILHKEQVNPPKVGKRERKVTLFINLGIFPFISESLIEFATFACNFPLVHPTPENFPPENYHLEYHHPCH